jgi:hypothetical protein
MFAIIASIAADHQARTCRVDEIAVASLSAPVDESRAFQVRNQLAQFARHSVSRQTTLSRVGFS